MYRGLLGRWESRQGGDPEHPNSGCMAVARKMFCAYQFKRCHSYINPKQPVCNWMCDLFINRCPEEKEFMNQICEGRDQEASESTSCSQAMGRYSDNWRYVLKASVVVVVGMVVGMI